jgi:hypothetical protein
MTVELQAVKTSGSQYKTNSYYLQDQAVVDELPDVWKAQPATLGFVGKLRRVVKWYKEFCKLKAKKRRAAEISLHSNLAVAQCHLQRDSTCSIAQGAVNYFSAELKEHELWAIEGQRLRARVRWRTSGDRNSKEFYQAIRPKATSTAYITGFQDAQGMLRTYQADMERRVIARKTCTIFCHMLSANVFSEDKFKSIGRL